MTTKKFMQTLDSKQYTVLSELAKKRGTNVQTFIRAIVVPEWLSPQQNEGHGPSSASRERSSGTGIKRRYAAKRRAAAPRLHA